MPRIQVYLPEHLYKEAKEQKMPVSEMLQDAIRAESKRYALDRYLEEMEKRIGPPSAEDTAAAEEWVRPIVDHLKKHGRL